MIIERGHRIRHFSNWATRPPPADFPMASASKWPSDREANCEPEHQAGDHIENQTERTR